MAQLRDSLPNQWDEVCVSKCANSDGFFLHSYYSLGPAGHPSVDSLVGHSLDESCVQRFWPAMW